MRNLCSCILILLALTAACDAGATGDPNLAPKDAKAVVIVCEGEIDDGLLSSIKRRANIAIEDGANYVILEISTYGGMLISADKIATYLILDLGKKVHTVAYVTTRAISAGAMISVSCRDIIMLENTTIGDCAPITMGGELKGVEREKIESFTRSAFARAAEANGYPLPLLEAMVTVGIEVYRVKNLSTGQFEFFEGDDLPKDPNSYDLDNKQRVVSDQQLLTLTASQALEYHIARAVVSNREEALAFLAKRDGVRFVGDIPVLHTSWSEEMVRWLNSPAVMSILVMVGLLGIYLELSTPGVGLPGLVAVICFATIIGSKFLIDMANWVEIAMFIAGLLLLFVELFILPGFGIAGIMGITLILVGLFGMMVKNPPNKLPIPADPEAWSLLAQGVLSLLFGVLGFAVLAGILTRFLPKLKMFSGLTLAPAQAAKGPMRANTTRPPGEESVELKPGDIGEVLSTLRPAGKARFGLIVADVVAQAEFIGRGSKVEICEIHGNRVVVKVVDEPSE